MVRNLTPLFDMVAATSPRRLLHAPRKRKDPEREQEQAGKEQRRSKKKEGRGRFRRSHYRTVFYAYR